ncbi:hypothetical protein VNI00_009145 [Paramarasmius palmivorus]|uniref:Carboxylic ester hydrolase n=1 Tax=Paramarasmius palmivorus TaxID=297713 RepID=A0AAW0CRV6_9AGAR
MGQAMQAFSIILSLSLAVLGSKARGRTVSLLFENDGNWEHFADRSSALFFHEVATKNEAEQVCREYGESLFEFEKMNDIKNQFVYQQYLGNLDEELWVSSNGGTCSSSVAAPSIAFGDPLDQFTLFSQNASCFDRDNSTSLPFLCTNSAPHTNKVDTDFASSPRLDVTSKDTIFTGTRDHLSFRFMGIPYAQPPLGKLRLRKPRPWKGASVDATAFKPGCLQWGPFENNAFGLNPWGISEDCLYLNIFTPYLPSTTTPPTQLKPVLVWIHGGGNFNGLGSDATFDGGSFVSRTDTVIVTFNYRLNVFGFLSLNDGVISGNYGFADMIAALEWVQDNIAAFGGDPQKVTVFGQSAGGCSVIDLLRSPPAKGLFSRAIVMSGGSASSTPEVVAAVQEPLVASLCNTTGVERLECLQGLPAKELLNAVKGNAWWASVRDGQYIPKESIFQNPEETDSVPVMMGWMKDEFQSILATTLSPNETDFTESLTKVFGPDLTKEVIESGLWKVSEEFIPYNATINVYTDAVVVCPAVELINAVTKSNALPALYVYTMKRAYGLTFFNPYGLCSFPVGHPQPHYACHSGDLYEVFGTAYLFDLPIRVSEDIHFTTLLQDMWSSFARTGNPNPDKRYLEVRGYAGEKAWVWPEFKVGGVASLDYPGLVTEKALEEEENGRCNFLMRESKYSPKPF